MCNRLSGGDDQKSVGWYGYNFGVQGLAVNSLSWGRDGRMLRWPDATRPARLWHKPKGRVHADLSCACCEIQVFIRCGILRSVLGARFDWLFAVFWRTTFGCAE